MMVMRPGQVVEQGLTDRVLDDPQHPYTQLLVSSVLAPHPAARRADGVARCRKPGDRARPHPCGAPARRGDPRDLPRCRSAGGGRDTRDRFLTARGGGMTAEHVFANARIVRRDGVSAGCVVVRGGVIAEIGEATTVAGATDCEGDFIIPGLIELHTDNLEKHVSPRPAVTWPIRAAVLAHDAQIATSGITTVFDAVTIGDIWGNPARVQHLGDMVAALDSASTAGALRAEHLLHLRAELSHANLLDSFESLAANARVRVVSLMDHTPGQRQFADLEIYRRYYQGKNGLSDAAMDALIEKHREAQRRHAAPNRRRVLEIARARGFILGSHDDASAAHVDEAAADGLTFTEFPTTPEAAHAAREHRIDILLGAPNVVRGGSHSGNVSAQRLARDGLIDILSSDYVPASLIHGIFVLNREAGLPLHDAVALASAEPAKLLGLEDRGRIETGRRADLVRVNAADEIPVIRGVWREGTRIA
jgi:alpha-D-ribose 1-methylphosphonate 5-triphosphate diphosphatase